MTEDNVMERDATVAATVILLLLIAEVSGSVGEFLNAPLVVHWNCFAFISRNPFAYLSYYVFDLIIYR